MKRCSRFFICLGLLVPLFAALSFSAWAVPDGPRHYYLGPWVWDDAEGIGPHWRAPEGTVGLVDLRGSSGGVGFFATDTPLDDPAYIYLGDSLDDPVDEAAWEAALPVDIAPASILDALWDTLTVHGDPDGVAMCPPIIPTSRGQLELHLGGHSLVRARKFNGKSDPAWPAIQARIQRDYRRIRAEAIRSGSRDRTVHQRQLAVWMHELGIDDEADLIPKDLPLERARKPETVIGDTFTNADSTSLSAHTATGPNGGFNWTIIGSPGFYITSNGLKANPTFHTHHFARAGAALSSANQTGSFGSTNTWGGLQHYLGIALRFSATEATCYSGGWWAAAEMVRIVKTENGTPTILVSQREWFTASKTPYTFTADGPTLTAVVRGVTATVTDPLITAGNYAGLQCYSFNGWQVIADNLVIEDLQGGSIAPHAFYYMRLRTSKRAPASTPLDLWRTARQGAESAMGAFVWPHIPRDIAAPWTPEPVTLELGKW